MNERASHVEHSSLYFFLLPFTNFDDRCDMELFTLSHTFQFFLFQAAAIKYMPLLSCHLTIERYSSCCQQLLLAIDTIFWFSRLHYPIVRSCLRQILKSWVSSVTIQFNKMKKGKINDLLTSSTHSFYGSPRNLKKDLQ